MHTSRLTTMIAGAAVVILAGSAVAVAAGDPTPTPPPKIAFVARGDGTNFADALAVGSVAGQLGAPVLTTSADTLPADTEAALTGYAPEMVIIAGGEAAVSAEVERAIESATGLPDGKVVRAAGATRYATAAVIAAIFDDHGIDPAYLPVAATATDSDLLDGKDATAFQPAGDYVTRADLNGLLPIATFRVSDFGAGGAFLTHASLRAPLTGAPTVNAPDESPGRYEVTLPGYDRSSMDLAFTCTPVHANNSASWPYVSLWVDDSPLDSTPDDTIVVRVLDTTEPAGIDGSFDCAVYEDSP